MFRSVRFLLIFDNFKERVIRKGHPVAQLIEALCCKSEVPDAAIGIFHFQNPMALLPGVDSASNTNEYQEYFLGVKAASG